MYILKRCIVNKNSSLTVNLGGLVHLDPHYDPTIIIKQVRSLIFNYYFTSCQLKGPIPSLKKNEIIPGTKE